MELLAQAVEEVSIIASDLRRETPVRVPRPEHIAAASETVVVQSSDPGLAPATPGEEPVGDPAYSASIGVLAGTRRGPGPRPAPPVEVSGP